MSILGDMAKGAINAVSSANSAKFDVCFIDEDGWNEENFITLLNKWDEIFQRKNLLIDPEEASDYAFVENQLQKIDGMRCGDKMWQAWQKLAEKPYWTKHNWTNIDGKRFSKNAKTYTAQNSTLTILHEPAGESYDYVPSGSYEIRTGRLEYATYGIWWRPNETSELGFVFQIFCDNLYPEGVLYLSFKNQESQVESAATITIVGLPPLVTDTSAWRYYERSFGLERLLTLLNRHETYDHLMTFIRQPYTISEKKCLEKLQKEETEMETRTKMVAKAAEKALLEKEAAERKAALEKEAAERKAAQEKEAAEKSRADALNALGDL